MNNRIFLILIVLLSCAILLVGGALIGAALYLQGNPTAVASFAPQNTPSALLEQQSGLPQVGNVAPDISISTPDGKTYRLSDFRGKPVMLNFWASWCGPCTAEMKNIEAVYQQHTGDDFVILAVNQGEGNDTIKGFAELWKLNFRLLHDDDDNAARAYRVQALPTTIFVDKAGVVYEVHIGGPMTQAFIEKRVNDLLAK